MNAQPKLFRVIFKALVLFIIFNLIYFSAGAPALGKLSLYNTIFAGRERFPFGEQRESYNLSLFDLDAMFFSHILAGAEKSADEYRVFLMGDSSVWGTLLTPEQTLAGQINANEISACGKIVRVYNLGYPTISLTKDLILLDQALEYAPDLIIWLTTLEAFPNDKQLSTPLVANNFARVDEVSVKYQLSKRGEAGASSAWIEKTLVGQRRALADWMRLQINGILWSATGVDQIYPADYEKAQTDLDADASFHDITDLKNALALDVLSAGMSAHPNMILINEPMLISAGANSDIRYNFFYPKWAYDEYRNILSRLAQENNWRYLDLWNIVPADEFTNSAIHLTSNGEKILAEKISTAIKDVCNK